METGYCRWNDIVLKYLCAASEIRTMQRKVRQGEARSDISAARTSRWFIYNRFSTVNSQPHVLTPIRPCPHSSHAPPRSLNSHIRACFIFIWYRMDAPPLPSRALSRCSRLPPSLTRETRNKQAIYIPRVAIVGYRCEVQFFPDFSFPFSLSLSPVFLCLLSVFSPSPLPSTTLFILSFNSKNTGFWF